MSYSGLSYWWNEAELQWPGHPETQLPRTCDVAIVGAGFTGLWTAYYLKQLDPDLDIVILEAETAGYGASGRNGGWCLGEIAGLEHYLANPALHEGAMNLLRAAQATVDEVARVCSAEQIDCHFQKGGSISVATTAYQAKYCQEHIREQYSSGLSETDLCWLDANTSRTRVDTGSNYGAMFMPHCAALHPLRLVQGLVTCLRGLGVTLVEQTPALSITPGRVDTTRGELLCGTALQATEGYTDSLRKQRRQLIPVYSLMVATEPLRPSTWEQIGLRNRETIASARRTVTYGQKTRDGRLAFGARGGYLFASGVQRNFSAGHAGLQQVAHIMRELFPILRDTRIEYAWGGMLGVSRSWTPHVHFDPSRRIGSAGGYVGEGVAATNLAARTLADLVLDRDTALTHLPWVCPPPRRWEPEPLRWLGYQLARTAELRADRYEMVHGRPSPFAGRLVDWLSS